MAFLDHLAFNELASLSKLKTARGFLGISKQLSGSDFLDGEKVTVRKYLNGLVNKWPTSSTPAPVCWDVNTMLNHLSAINNKTITLQQLGGKCALLILLSTMCRSGELMQLRISCINTSKDGSSIVFHLLHPTKTFNFFSSHNKNLQKLFVRSLPGHPSICAVTTLKDYITRTQIIQEGEDMLFILPGNKTGPASRQTVVRWVKDHFTAAGLGHFMVHSTRSAATSKALLTGMSVDEIVAKVGWLSKSTFVQTYMRPLSRFNNKLKNLSNASTVSKQQPSANACSKQQNSTSIPLLDPIPPITASDFDNPQTYTVKVGKEIQYGHSKKPVGSPHLSSSLSHDSPFAYLWQNDARLPVKKDASSVRSGKFVNAHATQSYHPTSRKCLKKAVSTICSSRSPLKVKTPLKNKTTSSLSSLKPPSASDIHRDTKRKILQHILRATPETSEFVESFRGSGSISLVSNDPNPSDKINLSSVFVSDLIRLKKPQPITQTPILLPPDSDNTIVPVEPSFDDIDSTSLSLDDIMDISFMKSHLLELYDPLPPLQIQELDPKAPTTQDLLPPSTTTLCSSPLTTSHNLVALHASSTHTSLPINNTYKESTVVTAPNTRSRRMKGLLKPGYKFLNTYKDLSATHDKFDKLQFHTLTLVISNVSGVPQNDNQKTPLPTVPDLPPTISTFTVNTTSGKMAPCTTTIMSNNFLPSNLMSISPITSNTQSHKLFATPQFTVNVPLLPHASPTGFVTQIPGILHNNSMSTAAHVTPTVTYQPHQLLQPSFIILLGSATVMPPSTVLWPTHHQGLPPGL